MLDNDSSCSSPVLQEMYCEPIPDDLPDMAELPASQGSDRRESGKAIFEEQKSLGVFPRMGERRPSVPEEGGSVGRAGGAGSGNGSGSGNGKKEAENDWSQNW